MSKPEESPVSNSNTADKIAPVRNVLMSQAEMREVSKLYILPHELVLMRTVVQDLMAKHAEAAAEFAAAMEQSSETFHDNAPAEVARDEAGIPGWKIQQLAGLATNYELVDYPSPDQAEVSLGSRVLVRLNTTEPFFVEIVGANLLGRDEYTDDFGNEVVPVTYLSPIGSAVLGQVADTSVETIINDKPAVIDLISVQQLPKP